MFAVFPSRLWGPCVVSCWVFVDCWNWWLLLGQTFSTCVAVCSGRLVEWYVGDSDWSNPSVVDALMPAWMKLLCGSASGAVAQTCECCSSGRVHCGCASDAIMLSFGHACCWCACVCMAMYVCPCAVTYPLDVVRRRMQLKGTYKHFFYRNTGHAFISILRQEGIQGFYNGLWPNLVKVGHSCVVVSSWDDYFSFSFVDHAPLLFVLQCAPAVAINFMTYEFVKARLNGVPIGLRWQKTSTAP